VRGHRLAVGPQPRDVGDSGVADRLAVEEPAPPEDRMVGAQPGELAVKWVRRRRSRALAQSTQDSSLSWQ
jgi:hypothetical protein